MIDPDCPTSDPPAGRAISLTFVGAGQMAEAILRGVLDAGVVTAGRVRAVDPSAERRAVFGRVGVMTSPDVDTLPPETMPDTRPVILLCVKPQHLAEALTSLRPSMARETPLLVSIAAGVSCATIEEAFESVSAESSGSEAVRVVRTMPNTPMLVGAGIVAVTPGTHATLDDLAVVRRVFGASAAVIDVPESLMNAVTAVSGSGPAYAFWLCEQMIRAGIDLGLPPDVARTLAVRTLVGVGRMLDTPDADPVDLRRRVTSPGGTTQAAMDHLTAREVDRTVRDAIAAAARRGEQLGG